MTPEQISAARARCEAATPGPWEERYVPSGMPVTCVHFGVINLETGLETGRNWKPEDAIFDAHARTDLPLALDAIAERDKRIADLQRFERSAVARLELRMKEVFELNARIVALTQALRKLDNEANGFLSMADPETHGYANTAILQQRIGEFRMLLDSLDNEDGK